jgi:hypothetical protein
MVLLFNGSALSFWVYPSLSLPFVAPCVVALEPAEAIAMYCTHSTDSFAHPLAKIGGGKDVRGRTLRSENKVR